MREHLHSLEEVMKIQNRKLVILDKDGTLVEPASGSKFVQDPFDQQLLPGIEIRIRELKLSGATLVIASNQGGIAAGHKSVNSAIAEMHYVMRLISEACGDFVIRTGYFCPDFDGYICYGVNAVTAFYSEDSDFAGIGIFNGTNYRKPQPGMLLLAMEQESCSNAIMIGDRPEDQVAAAAAEIQFIWAKDFFRGLS
jgi:D-glycero-D-manno-heptose 1,7-bisphosphate phosphatase